ncbi:MAG: ribosome small subunit-dependent GTPase A [Rhodocyclaceae bacterium]|nr:ribosome small subunit-dependent GTPase A [Rhodocyclaceae bacterium]MDP1957564.1 ribosome small subunit-dependent GTPase A [Rhodocyclaceae bacterium]
MLTGTIAAAFGRHYEIALDDGRIVNGIPRGKKSPYACGDRVTLGPLHDSEAQILNHAPRSSLLYRSDQWKQKLIAANATQIVLVVATEPGFSTELISRALVAAEHEQMRAVIVLNKADLTANLPAARAQLAPFTKLDLPVVELSALTDAKPLLPWLADQTSVLVGQSGMGKSTLANALIPGAGAATREISTALDAGKHTTTHARRYPLPGGGMLIDSPGLQEFGLAHLTRGEIELGFAEFAPLLGHCRFRDCRHENEPDCALKAAVASGALDARRLAHFLAITA